jgi:Schlafen, AlbA_2
MNPWEAPGFHNDSTLWLRRITAAGESVSVEFKRKASFPMKLIREMVAFANTHGGILLIGVDDNGTPVGLKYPEEESYVIRRASCKFCRPRLAFKEHVLTVSPNRFVLVYDIPSSARKPHFLFQGRRNRDAYVRVADKSIKASREMLEIVRHRQRTQDLGFTYGEPERTLFHYLDRNKTITLTKFAEISGLQLLTASERLILLVLTDILLITPHERGDLYSMAAFPAKY